MPSYSLGIDIGGTFTDIVVYDHDSGRQWSRKVLTTHDDPARAVAAGVATLLREGQLEARHFTRVVHATTLFTNALIERKGAVTGLITTAGFADTLEIGRERKFELYDLDIAKPDPLVPRNLRLEVDERMRPDGRVRRPLDPAEVTARARALVEAGVTSIAVVFLHAYANPEHETLAARIIGERHPDVAVTASHEVAAEIREYERASTAVANAYIKPLARRYLELMAQRLTELGDSGSTPPDAQQRRTHPRSRRPRARPSGCSSRARRRAPSRPPSSAVRTAAATCSPSTWAERPPSSRSSTAESR